MQTAECGINGRQAAMKQHQRLPSPVDLVIYGETVYGSIAALGVLVPFMRLAGRALCHDDFPFLVVNATFTLKTR